MAPKRRGVKSQSGRAAFTARRRPRGRQPRSVERMPYNPPQHKYNTVIVRTTARIRFDKKIVFDKMDKLEFDVYTLLSKTYWKSIIKSFDEIKLTKVNVWCDYALSNITSGRAGLVLIPDHTSLGDEGHSDFTQIMELPNAMVRRPYQTLHTHWFPTEPSDREWCSTDDKGPDPNKKIVTIITGTTLMPPANTQKDRNVSYQLTIDMSFKLRGISGVACSVSKEATDHLKSSLRNISNPDFEIDFDMINDSTS